MVSDLDNEQCKGVEDDVKEERLKDTDEYVDVYDDSKDEDNKVEGGKNEDDSRNINGFQT